MDYQCVEGNREFGVYFEYGELTDDTLRSL